MKNIMLSFLIVSGCSFNTVCMEPIVLPSPAVLNKRLNDKLGFDHFNSKTYLGDKLGNSKMPAFDVVMQVNVAVENYFRANKGMDGQEMVVRRKELLELILQDNPATIESFKKMAFFKNKGYF